MNIYNLANKKEKIDNNKHFKHQSKMKYSLFMSQQNEQHQDVSQSKQGDQIIHFNDNYHLIDSLNEMNDLKTSQRANQNTFNRLLPISKNQQFDASCHSHIQQQVKQQSDDNASMVKDIIMFPKIITKIQSTQKNIKQQTQIVIQMQSQKPAFYPWLSQKSKSIQNPLIKLHNQMIEYFLMFQEQQDTHNHLLSSFSKLQGLVFKTFKNCDVLAPFLTNQVYLKNSQVEMFLLFDQSSWKSSQTISKVKQCLQKNNFHHIRFFQVPSVQNTHKQHKIGFNCLSPQKNYPFQIKIVTQQWLPFLSMINDVLQNSLESKYLFFVFDTIVRQRGLENSIKSYLTLGLISVFIHQRKRQKSRSLTENLLKFLEYFGVGPFTQRRICYLGRNEFQIKQDPQNYNSGNNYSQFSFWVSQNIDISNHMVRQFFSILRNRYRLISNFNYSHSESILASLINPTYDQFRY